MKILGIDPGPKESAYVLWDSTVPNTIRAHGKHPNKEFLTKILSLMPRTDFCVIEMVASFGMAVGAEVFETVYWIGRFAQAWDHAAAIQSATAQLTDRIDPGWSPAVRIFRSEIKMNLCHSMKAKDSNIRQALIDRIGPPGTKKNPGPTFGISGDVWSALAIAVTFGDKSINEISQLLLEAQAKAWDLSTIEAWAKEGQ